MPNNSSRGQQQLKNLQGILKCLPNVMANNCFRTQNLQQTNNSTKKQQLKVSPLS